MVFWVNMNKVPKGLEFYSYFYPAIHFIEVFFLFAWSIHSFNPFIFILFIFATYFQSPMIWRILVNKYGEPPEKEPFGKRHESGNLWFISYNLSQLYNHLKFLERVLKLFPEGYSSWLRLWGAKVGKKINWTAESHIVDRPFITIGNRVLFGHQAQASSHIIRKEEGKYIIYLKGPIIEDDCVLGFQCFVSPGSHIKKKAYLDAGAVAYPEQIIEEGVKHERFREILTERYNFLYEEFKRRSSVK
jgi:acetyltransferase-like isoleucine patch superfamily enzyme